MFVFTLGKKLFGMYGWISLFIDMPRIFTFCICNSTIITNNIMKMDINNFPSNPGARQIIHIELDLIQTSCGFAVPFFDFKGDRDQLKKWALHKGEEGIKEYWNDKNLISLDGKKTGIIS